MNALAWSGIPDMECHSPELDHERRFQPSASVVEAFLRAVGPFTEPRRYELSHPHAFTRTTYFDTEELSLLASRGTGFAQRLRLREYAGAVDLAQPPVLTGQQFLEVKVTSGERRMKFRCPLSGDEAQALLSGTPLPEESAAAQLLKRLTPAPVKPMVTAWYRRITRVTSDERVRITLDEDLTFALPPAPGEPAAPTRLLQQAPSSLLEVKWQTRPPYWLERALVPLMPSETQGSKFEEGMRALFGGSLPLPLVKAR